MKPSQRSRMEADNLGSNILFLHYWGWVLSSYTVWDRSVTLPFLHLHRSFHHLIITSKPFNHQQWSQDGKRVKGADQTRPRVMMTGEGRWPASSLHAVSFPTDPFRQPFTPLRVSFMNRKGTEPE